MTRVKGFTLVEMMVVVALLAIMASVAVPAYQSLIQNNRLSSTTNALLGGLQLARSEAVTTRTSTTICGANAAQNDCVDSTAWDNGALVRQGANLVRVIPWSTGVTATSSEKSLTYNANGTAASSATVVVSDSRGASSARTITVNVIGPACLGTPCQ